MNWRFHPGWLGAAILYCSLAAPRDVEGQIVLSDNFNAENGGVGALNYTNFGNFNVTTGSVDLIGNGFFDFYPGSGLYIDLNGSTGVSGTLESKAVFAPGTYTLSFNLGNNGAFASANSVTASLDGFSETFTRSGSPAFQTITRSFTTTSSGRLIFATPASDGDNAGIVLDNVVLSATAVPEPSTVALIAAALPVALGLYCRNRGRPAA